MLSWEGSRSWLADRCRRFLLANDDVPRRMSTHRYAEDRMRGLHVALLRWTMVASDSGKAISWSLSPFGPQTLFTFSEWKMGR